MESSSTASTASTESETSASMESESSESSAEEPVPAKKVKGNKKKPAKELAKLARKKNDKKSKRSILKHVKEAEKVTSDAVGSEMDEELVRIEGKIDDWMARNVEQHAMQRFAARFLKFIKKTGVVGAVDHAVFLHEIGRIHLLEMDMVGSLDKTNDKTNLEMARAKANELLHKVFDSGASDRLERSLQGTTWRYPAQEEMDDSVFTPGQWFRL